MMGGIGSRFGAQVPKQFIRINEVPVYRKILNLYNKAGLIDDVLIICNEKWLGKLKEELIQTKFNFRHEIIAGGMTRSGSIRNGVLRLKEENYDDDTVVLIHDATHPYLDIRAVGDLCTVLNTYEAATLVTHVWDTVYLSDEDQKAITLTLPREKIAVGASPEGFQLSLLKSFYLSETVDRYTSVGNFLSENGIQVKLVWTDICNLKITYPEDLELYLKSYKYFDEANDDEKKLHSN